MQITGKCKICADKSYAESYGAEACRACAAFFRRSVVLKKKYVCRAGTNGCATDCRRRYFCRKCRLQRCFDAGMSPKKLGKPPSPEFDTSGIELKRIYSNFKKLREDHLELETKMIAEISSSPMDDERLSAKGMVIICQDDLSRIYRALQPSIMKFLVDNFHQFRQLSVKEQLELFRGFILHFFNFVSCLLTVHHVPKDCFEKYEIWTHRAGYSATQLDIFLADQGESAITTHKYEIIRELMLKKNRKALWMLDSMKLDDQEIVAIIGLLLFQHNNISVSEETEKICATGRGEIFEALRIYYEMLGRCKPLQRMGEVMDMHSAILQRIANFQQVAPLMYFYGQFDGEPFLYDAIK